MSELHINYIIQILNIGMPTTLLAIYFKLDKKHTFILCGIGAILPLLMFFLYVTFKYHLSNIKSDDLNFTYHAMWQMAGWAGPVLILLGILVGRFLLRSHSKIKNLILGISILPLIWGLVYAAGNT